MFPYPNHLDLSQPVNFHNWELLTCFDVLQQGLGGSAARSGPQHAECCGKIITIWTLMIIMITY